MEGEESVLFSADDEEGVMPRSTPQVESTTNENKPQTPDSDKETGRSQALAQQVADPADYHSTEVTPEGVVGRGWSFDTPAPSHGEGNDSYFEAKQASTPRDDEASPSRSRSRSGSRFARARRPQMPPRPRSSIYAERTLPPAVGRPVS
ncbi:hypothetical protein FRC09_018191, partial [Ceratobasidium sp. 395]